jgi:hypothetical protein
MEQRIAELTATYEGEKGTLAAQISDLSKKYADIEKVATERETKLKDYDLRDTTRSLIKTDFAALLADFDNDPVAQAGVLAIAKSGDPEALKTALAASLAAKQSGTTLAVNQTLLGASPAAPAGSAPATETIAQLQEKIRTLNPVKDKVEWTKLMAQLSELEKKERK